MMLSLPRSLLFALVLVPLMSCRTTSGSHEMVTNGDPNDPFPASIMIRSESSQCTGTFISDRLLITAAHCVGKARSIYFFRGSERVNASSFIAHPQFDYQVGKNDVGLVWFPPGTASVSVPLCENAAKAADPVRLVGYGCNDITSVDLGFCQGAGVLRTGTNWIGTVNDGALSLRGLSTASSPSVPLGEQSMTGKGDSGGPWLVRGCIAGITSGGSSKDSTAASLHHPAVLEFLKNYNVSLGAAKNGAPAPITPSIQPPAEQPSSAVAIESFDADRTRIKRGESAQLSWKVSGASRVEILGDGQVLATGLTGLLRVSPRQTTVYTLRFTDPRGSVGEFIFTVTIEVDKTGDDPLNNLLDAMRGG